MDGSNVQTVKASKKMYAMIFCMHTYILMGWQSVMIPFLAPHSTQRCETKFDETANASKGNSSLFNNCSEFEHYHSTLTEKFDLTGDRSWLISFASTLFMLGGLASNVICGYLADKIGRKRTISALALPYFAANVLLLTSTNYIMLAVSQFLNGMGALVIGNIAFVILLESVDQKHRTLIGISMELPYLFGNILICGVSWLLRNWFYIQLVNVILMIISLPLLWLLPESQVWQNTRTKSKNFAYNPENTTCKTKIEIDFQILATQENSERHLKLESSDGSQKEISISILDLFRTPCLRKYTLILWIANFTIGIFYAQAINIEFFGTDFFRDFMASSVLSVPSQLICMFLIRYVLLTKLTSASLILSAITFFIYAFTESIPNCRAVMAILGWIFSSPALIMLFTLMADIYPTVIRGMGMGCAFFVMRIGNCIGPFAKEIGELTADFVPMVFFGIISLVSGVLLLKLPSSKDSPLVNFVEEVEELGNM